MVELAYIKLYQFHQDETYESTFESIIRPLNFNISHESFKIHGISHEKATNEGKDVKEVLDRFIIDVMKADFVVGFNIDFDVEVINQELILNGYNIQIPKDKTYCVMKQYNKLFQQKNERWLKLNELYHKLFNKSLIVMHRALHDSYITARCFKEIFSVDTELNSNKKEYDSYRLYEYFNEDD